VFNEKIRLGRKIQSGWNSA